MKFKYILTIFLAVIIIFSCKKFVVDISPEYKGEWHASPVAGEDGIEYEEYFIINGEQGVYGLWCELSPLGHNCSKIFSGDVEFNGNKSKFYIGPLKDRIVLRVDVPPHINSNGDWECTLTSTVFIRN